MSDITEDSTVETESSEVEPGDATVTNQPAAAESEINGSAADDPSDDEAETTDEVEVAADADADEVAEDAEADEVPTEEPAEPVATDTDDGEADEGQADESPAAVEVEEIKVPRRKSPYDRPGRWYVIHTQSGYENKVRSNLMARTQSMNMEERIFEVVIPVEDVVEFKNGKKVVVQKKVFPGYLLTRMHLDDDSWFVVRNTPGVTGFIGAGNKPSPLPRRDVENFLSVKEDGDEPSRKGKPRLEYSMNETVRVKEGPFADFQGEIVEIHEDQLKLKVLVNIFGRETPVELQFAQVGKI